MQSQLNVGSKFTFTMKITELDEEYIEGLHTSNDEPTVFEEDLNQLEEKQPPVFKFQGVLFDATICKPILHTQSDQ